MELITDDKMRIAAHWHAVDNPKGFLILLHMMPATKNSWHGFADFMLQHGYSSLAIDLRGHGESTGGPDGYKSYTDIDHQKSILDVDQASRFVRQKGADHSNTIFVGASIGANLALQYIALHQNFRAAALLSPGLNYRGINAERLVMKLMHHQRVFFAAARDDDRVRGNAEMTEGLHASVPIGVKKELVIYETGGHGTDIFGEHPELMENIKAFIEG